MWARFCRFLLTKVMGWTIDSPAPAPEKKVILLGVPHTSAWDFVVSYLFYRQFDGPDAKVMIKKEFFFWPIGGLLRKLGAIPVDRSSASAMVKSLIEQMNAADSFHLAIAPEGTRKATRKWKTGYHLIAKEVGCPVYMAYFDWGTKHIGIGNKIGLTDDARADTDRIQKIYGTMNLKGKYPEDFVTE